MRTRRMVTLLRYVTQNQNHGFTLMEMMVVMIIGGILAAIALPAFLGRANSAKQAEAKTYLGALNRAQQAYFTERSSFTDNIANLGIAAPGSTNYKYSIKPGANGSQHATHYAESQFIKLRPYVGMAAIVQSNTGEIAIRTILCEAEQPSLGKASDPTYSPSAISCAPSTRPLD